MGACLLSSSLLLSTRYVKYLMTIWSMRFMIFLALFVCILRYPNGVFMNGFPYTCGSGGERINLPSSVLSVCMSGWYLADFSLYAFVNSKNCITFGGVGVGGGGGFIHVGM